MKILVISTSPPDYLGGLAHFTKNLINLLGENEIDVDFLCSTLSKEGPYQELYTKKIRIFKEKCYLFPNNENILRLKYPIFKVLPFLLKNGKKYDLIHVHSYIYFSTIQTFIYKIFFNKRIPVILHLHGGVQTEDFQATSFIEKILLLMKRFFFDLIIGKLMINRANAVISVSKEDLLQINNVFRTKRLKNNYYLPNAIDIKIFRKVNDIPRKYVGFIGRLTKIKGIDIFIEVIKQVHQFEPSIKYLIIGEGPYLLNVERILDLYPVEFHPSVQHSEMPLYYNQCKIFLQTSRAEGLPTCVLEALSCEVPVIASNVGGIKEIISNNVNGHIYESGDVKAIVKIIKDFLNRNDLERMGYEGRKIVEKKYSWQKIVKKIIHIYALTIKK
ncbi:MAG: glycosyltransferase family 4 protein [Promethearchaeota archaeon]